MNWRITTGALTMMCILSSSFTAQPQDDARWGADDELGAANLLTSSKVLEAASLIESGTVYELGHTYERGMPISEGRYFNLTLAGSPTGGPLGTNELVYFDEIVSGQLGQVGTQFDGLGHAGVRSAGRDVFYNGNDREEIAHANGLSKLGMEKLGPIVTRGVLVDVAAFKGVERLEPGYTIGVDDLTGALERERVSIRSGDVVLIRTGHGRLWMKDNGAYMRTHPGIGRAAGKWLAEQDVVVIGADTSGVEVRPAEDPEETAPVHQLLLIEHGIYLHENLALEKLAVDRVYEFAYVFVPLKLKGAASSPGSPLAIR